MKPHFFDTALGLGHSPFARSQRNTSARQAPALPPSAHRSPHDGGGAVATHSDRSRAVRLFVGRWRKPTRASHRTRALPCVATVPSPSSAKGPSTGAEGQPQIGPPPTLLPFPPRPLAISRETPAFLPIFTHPLLHEHLGRLVPTGGPAPDCIVPDACRRRGRRRYARTRSGAVRRPPRRPPRKKPPRERRVESQWMDIPIGVVRRKPCDSPCAGMGRAGSPCPPEPVMPKDGARDARRSVFPGFRPDCIRTSNDIQWHVPASGGEGTRRPTRLRTDEITSFCLTTPMHSSGKWTGGGPVSPVSGPTTGKTGSDSHSPRPNANAFLRLAHRKTNSQGAGLCITCGFFGPHWRGAIL